MKSTDSGRTTATTIAGVGVSSSAVLTAESAAASAVISSASHPHTVLTVEARSQPMSSTAATGQPAATPVTVGAAKIAVPAMSVGAVKQEIAAATGSTATANSTLQERHSSVSAGLASAVVVSKALTAGTVLNDTSTSVSPSTAVRPGSSVYGAVSDGKAVSTASLKGGVSGSLEGGANAGGLGVPGRKAGVRGGTQSAGLEMKAGLFGGEATAGILGSTGTFSIEAAGRAAALADGVIRSGELGVEKIVVVLKLMISSLESNEVGVDYSSSAEWRAFPG